MNHRVIMMDVANWVLRALAITFALFSTSVSAATVADYSFTGNSLTSSDSDSSSTAADIIVGAGLSGNTSFFTPNSNPPALGMGSDITPATEASAISLNDYISFTLTPANGVSLAYTLLSFALNVNNGGDDITANISVRWNVDAFATALVTKTRLVLSGNSTTSGSAVTLSSFPAQSIPVEFRFYFFDDQDNAFTTVGIDSITLTGTVVPEPSSFALLVLGWFCFARLTSIRRSTRN